MLIHASSRDNHAVAIPGRAHIVICLGASTDDTQIHAFSGGEIDSSYSRMSGARIAAEVARLVDELRARLLDAQRKTKAA